MHVLAQDVEAVARQLSSFTGQSIDDVVREAIEARARAAGVQLPSPPRRKTVEERIAGMRAISDRCAALPVLDDRTPDEIIGYDEFGVPR